MNDLPVPLATYTERLLQVRRDLALFEDRVEVDAHWLLGGTFHSTVRLAELSPRTAEIHVRNRWAKRAVLIGSLAVAAAVVFGRQGSEAWLQRASLAAWAVAGVCAAVLALTARRIRFVRLLRPDGRPGLDIAQAGPDAERLDAFVAAIKRQMRK